MKKELPKLTKTELVRLTKRFPAWSIDADAKKAVLTLQFKRHVDALVCIARISVHAEVLQHFPEIHFTKARLKITTTSEKKLTTQDVELIKRIEHVIEKVDK
jgi:pterin-4a-carbinolamine dehydratase